MNKKTKTDIRLYIDDDYKSYLKLLAAEQEKSLNAFVLDALNKKFPFNRKAKNKLKNLDNTNPEVSSSVSLDAGTDDMTLEDEKQPLDILSSSATVPTVADVPTEESETLSVNVESGIAPDEDTDNQEITIPDDEDSTYKYFDGLLSRGSTPELFTKKERKAMKRRIASIGDMIKTAQETGNHIPKPEYAKLAEQKKQLIAIVYPNNNNQ